MIIWPTIAALLALICSTAWVVFLRRNRYGRFLARHYPGLAALCPIGANLVFILPLFNRTAWLLLSIIFILTAAPQVASAIVQAANDYFEARDASKEDAR